MAHDLLLGQLLHYILRYPLSGAKRRDIQRLRHPNTDVQRTIRWQRHALEMRIHPLVPPVGFWAG